MRNNLIIILLGNFIIFTVFGHLFESGIMEINKNNIKIVDNLKKETTPFSEAKFYENIHCTIVRINLSDIKNKWLNISGVISRIGFVFGFWCIVLVLGKYKFLSKKLRTNLILLEKDKNARESISRELASSIQQKNPFFIAFLKKCLLPALAIFLSFIVISLEFLDILISPIIPVVKALFKFFEFFLLFFPQLDGYVAVLIVIICYIVYLLFLSVITVFLSFKIWSIIKLRNINKFESIKIDLLTERDLYKFFRISIYIILGIILLTSYLQEPLGLHFMFS